MTTPQPWNFEDFNPLQQTASPSAEIMVVQGGQVYRLMLEHLPLHGSALSGEYLRSASVSQDGGTLSLVAVGVDGNPVPVSFAPDATRAGVYALLKAIIQAGANITLTPDDGAETIAVAGQAGGGGGGSVDYGIRYNRIDLPYDSGAQWTYVTGSLANADTNGEIAEQLGSPGRFKVVTANAGARALIRQWGKVGQKFELGGTRVLTLTQNYAESPTGTFTLTGTLSGAQATAGATTFRVLTPYALRTDELDGAGIVALLAALTGTARLSYNSLKDTPAGANATHAEVAYEGVWDESMDRTFVSAAQSDSTFGEARYTEPTGISQDRELYVDYKDADERDREEWLKGLPVGKWIRCTKKSNTAHKMLFKVEAVSETDSAGKQFYFTAANAEFLPNEAAWPSDASLTGDFTFETTDLDLAIYVKTDGSNVTDDLRTAVQGINESRTLASQYTRRANSAIAGEWYVSGTQFFLNVVKDSADDASLTSSTHITSWIDIGSWRIRPTGNISRSEVGNVATFTFNYATINGTIPSIGTVSTITVEGADIHRGEVVSAAFRDNVGTIAHNYLRTTGASKDVIVETPLSEIGTSESEKKMAMAGAIVKAINAIKGWRGIRRELRGPGSVAASGAAASLTPISILKASVTPDSTTQRIRVSVSSFLSRDRTNGAILVIGLRMKKGTGSYTGITNTGQPGQLLATYNLDDFDYSDWMVVPTERSFEIISGTTDAIEFNLFAATYNQAESSNKFNRGTVYWNSSPGFTNPVSTFGLASPNTHIIVEKFAEGGDLVALQNTNTRDT